MRPLTIVPGGTVAWTVLKLAEAAVSGTLAIALVLVPSATSTSVMSSLTEPIASSDAICGRTSTDSVAVSAVVATNDGEDQLIVVVESTPSSVPKVSRR